MSETMLCPNCKHELSKVMLSLIEVDHCNVCGGTLFDVNEINRISQDDAKRLSQMKTMDTISGGEKYSPRDGSPLKRLVDESVPQHVTLLTSEKTGEVFAYPDDLVHFKEAQNAKVNYFKAWNIPLPAPRSVLIYGLIMAITVSTVFIASQLDQKETQSIQASSFCVGGHRVYVSGGATLVSCETEAALRSKALVMCGGNEREYDVNTDPASVHILNLYDSCQQIKFIFEDESSVYETAWLSLESAHPE